MENTVLWKHSFENHNNYNFFSKDRKYFYSGKARTFLRLDAETGKIVNKYNLRGSINGALETDDKLYVTTDKKCHIINKDTFELIEIHQQGICNYSDSIATNGEWLITANIGSKMLCCLNLISGEWFKKKVERPNGVWHIEKDVFYIAGKEALIELQASTKKTRIIHKIDFQKQIYDYQFGGVYLDIKSQLFYHIGLPNGTLYEVNLKTKTEKSILIDTTPDHDIYPILNQRKIYLGGGMLYNGGAYLRYSPIIEVDLQEMKTKTITTFDKFIVKGIDPESRKIVINPLLTYWIDNKDVPLLQCIVF